MIPSFGRVLYRKIKQHYLWTATTFKVNELTLMYGEIWLDIGFGSGESLLNMATNHPNIHLIGTEIYINGISSVTRKILEKDIKNISLYTHDVRFLLQDMPDNTLARIFILFPDPWHKNKHKKRRLINKAFVNLLKMKLIENGESIIATDDLDYYKSIHELLEKDFNTTTYNLSDLLNIETKYQQKAKNVFAIRCILQ